MSEIKTCFTSRFDGGRIVEADFSQLEVAGLAVVSGDDVLKQDIRDGVDMHCMNASFLYRQSYDSIKSRCDAGDAAAKQMRQEAKSPGFLLQYGGGANLMSKNTGISKRDCQQFIDNYYKRYKGVKAFQDSVARVAAANRIPSSKKTASGQPTMAGVYKSITGRRYVFNEYDNQYKGGTSFSPTELKNYPIQGFSTGDIVPEVLGRLFRYLTKLELHDRILLVGTVHDSVVCDVNTSKIDIGTIKAILKKVMEKVPEYMEERFGVEIDIPIKVDVGVGNTWAETK